jgi:hypothetical protein
MEECMTPDRRELDMQVTETDAIEKVTADLGLRGEGKRYYCPGCQPVKHNEPDDHPEMVIKDGWFHCFRCDAQGDIVGLVKLAKRCGLETAMEWLEQETTGIREH